MSIYQVTWKGLEFDSSQLRNVWHYEFFQYVPDLTQRQDFIDNLDILNKAQLQNFFHDEIDILGYDMKRVDVGGLPTEELIPTAGLWSGTASGDALPAQCSLLVTWKTATFYPRTTRTYLWPFTANNLSAGGILPTANVAALETWANAMLQIEVTGAGNPDKVAVQYGGTPRAVTDHNSLDTYVVNRVYATQRRRKAGVGA